MTDQVMLIFALSLVILIVLPIVNCLSDDIWKDDGLYILNDENFETAIHEFNVLFVNFYDPDNNRSRIATHPQMTYAAELMENDDIPVAFARMDCSTNDLITNFYNFTAFPTLRLFRFGRIVPEEYQHARVATEMVEWIRHKTNQITEILRTKDDLFQLQQKAGINNMVIGLFHNFNGLLSRGFCLSAMTEKTLFFGMALTSNKEIFYEIVDKKEKNAEKILVLKIGSDAEGKKSLGKVEMNITENTNELDVWQFIKDTAHPLITTFQEENAMKLFSSKLQVHALLFTNIELKSHFESMEIFKQVALLKKRRFHFMNVLSNATRLMKSFDIYYDDLPVFYLLDMANGLTYEKYKHEGPLTVDSMIKFMNDFSKGELKGSRLRQPKTAEEIGADYYESIGKKHVGEREEEDEEEQEYDGESEEVKRRTKKIREIEIELDKEIAEMKRKAGLASTSDRNRGSDEL